jgi:SP family general alpha glucoside:H+ symporter-like MFS transporter
VLWTYYRVPEPKGRTYGEPDVLFERGVSARKFSSTAVDAFEAHNEKMASSDSGENNGFE